MRKLMLALLLSSSSSYISYGQLNEESPKKKIVYGVKSGMGYSSLLSENRTFFKGNRIGVVLGGFMRLQIGESSVLQPEVLFIQKGGSRDITSTLTFSDQIGPNGMSHGYYKVIKDQKLSYISTPINIHTNLSEKFSVLYGIEPSFLYSEAYRLRIDDEPTTYKSYGDINSIDLGVNLGFSYLMSNFSLDLKLNQGVVKVGNNELDKTFNSSIQFTLGYLFK